MRLKLFDTIDETIEFYNFNLATYKYVQGLLISRLTSMVEQEESYLGYTSRIKAVESLKSKIIKNRYYLKYQSGKEIIDHLPDLIGIGINCLFLSDEIDFYYKFSAHFKPHDQKWFVCKHDDNLFLDLHMPQPQTQNNGYKIIRVDGYYQFNGMRVNFELQVKSLTHGFWSEIEHQVVYKNNKMISFDGFVKQMLATIRSNLDVVDSQLKIVYDQMVSQRSALTQDIFAEDSFKMFIAASINELYILKMQESAMIDADFKECSKILGQYIYINDLLRSDYPQQKILSYYEHFNYLKEAEIVLTDQIEFNGNSMFDDVFSQKFYQHCLKVINQDFNWHVFFGMLFTIQTGDNDANLVSFIKVIKELLITPSWFKTMFEGIPEQSLIHDTIMDTLVDTLIDISDIKIIYEKNLYQVMTIFVSLVNDWHQHTTSYQQWLLNENTNTKHLRNLIYHVFNRSV